NAEVAHEHQLPFVRGPRPWAPRSLTRSPELLALLFGERALGSIESITAADPRFGDDTLKCISTLDCLAALDVKSDKITSHGLASLKSSTRLYSLAIESSALTDQGLAELSKLSSVRQLWIIGPSISDEGLTHIAQMAELRVLHIEGPSITNNGLAQ